MATTGRLAALLRDWIRADAGKSRMLLAMFVALATFTAALIGGFLHATRTADTAIRANERHLLENQIAVSTRSMMESQVLQLSWDDAMRAAGDPAQPIDRGWTDAYFGEVLGSLAHADELYLVNPRGELLRGWRGGRPVGAADFRPLASPVRRMLASADDTAAISGKPVSYRTLPDGRWPIDAKGRPLSRWSGGLLLQHGRPAMITIIPLLPDMTYGLLRRTPNHMVAIRYLEGSLLRGIGDAMLLQDLRFTAGQSDPSGQRNALALADVNGQPFGWLTWQPHLVGPVLMRRTAPMLAGYLLFFCIVLTFGLLVIRQAMQMGRELAVSEARAQYKAMHDPLLGLPNRTNVMQRLTAMLDDSLQRATGAGEEQVVLAYFDLDRFKSINESVGHHVGDDLLAQVVARLRDMTRPGDVLGRLASDEFVIVRRGADGEATADVLGAELMDLFVQPFSIEGQSVPITASCGISWAPEQAEDAKTVLRNADIALFQAKARGRARYRRFTAEMDATIRWRRDMESELRQAIARNGLSMVYQPIVNVADGSIASFEALVRWTHRDRGEISPAVFVAVAEQSGLMPELGQWVLRRVFADSRDFGTAEVSINLSPLQLVARDFMPSLKALISEERVDPSRFTFEITEGVLLDRSQRVMDLLSELQDMGFRIALDDFGSGYSSLAYLRTFQFDRIKVDRSFVQGIEHDVDAQAILRAIVSLGRTLRMKVVAEGVETLVQQQLVQAAGCQYIQGYLYWRAMSADQVIGLLATDRVQSLRLAV